MKRIFQLGMVAAICFAFIACPKDKKSDNTLLIGGLLYLNQNKTASVASQFPNSVSGSSTAIQGSTASTTATTSATTSASASAQTAAASALEPVLRDAASQAKGIAETKITTSSSSTCNGATLTASGTYTTTSTQYLTTAGATTTSVTSSFYTVKPNLSIKVTYSCNYPSNTSSSYTATYNISYTLTGSVEVTFSSAVIKYFDIESFVKSGTFSYKTATLTGTVTVSSINQTGTSNGSTTYTSSTGKYVSTGSSNWTYSDTAKTSNLVVDSNSAATFDLTESGVSNFSSTFQYSTSGTSCYSALSIESGGKVSGTYNNAAVSTSYNITTDDYKKLLAAQGFTVTTCQ